MGAGDSRSLRLGQLVSAEANIHGGLTVNVKRLPGAAGAKIYVSAIQRYLLVLVVAAQVAR